MNHAEVDVLPVDTCVAIVGMACHFPDARTPEEFWRNLSEGRESVRDLDEATLRAGGAKDADLADPSYVRRGAPLEGFDCFDATFFGLSPGEARIMDPQHRRFIECAWSALEDAGHTPKSADGNIGVFAGSGMHWYLLRNLMTNPALVRELGEFQLRLTANDSDFLATRASYHMDLRGPSMSVQTACSSSLVAVHMACQSLLSGESDLALAGGVSIQVPHNVGYFYREEEVCSPDGHCRAMDAGAAGTVFASGCGVVVLRRLQDALDDGDTIHAVIRGSAVNNDGAGKAGYLAPSVDGQAAAIAEAIAVASVDPATIGYVEAHGTGTRIGDPIEIAALTQGFGPTRDRQYCALGSVKTNIGHLDAAAGIAGLIKIALSMRHRRLPPSLHFRSPNPEIDFAASPFHVNTALVPWPELGAPLRAGISSLGVGGTNAHVVLEEAPQVASIPPVPSSAHAKDIWILPLSARTPTALAEVSANLLAHLEQHPDLSLRDVAWTLRAGRVPLAFRSAVAGGDSASVVAQLRASRQIARAAETPPRIVFMFPGQGAQYPEMARRLHAIDPHFRSAIDECVAVLRRIGRHDAVDALLPRGNPVGSADPAAVASLRATVITQPVMFCTEYALAQSLRARGVQPAAMIGHSLGEYVAASLAGIFHLDAALALVCRRGELVAALPGGAMLAVALGRQDVEEYLSDRVCLASINGPESCVCSGDVEAIGALEARLATHGVAATRLATSHAFHSHMLDPILQDFRNAVVAARPSPVAESGVISNVTGGWLSATDAGSPDYWVDHLRQAVNFEGGMRQLQAMGPVVHVEVGPGNTLSGLATGIAPDARVVTTLPHRMDSTPDDELFHRAGGLLWAHGVEVDWAAWGQPVSGWRLPLPTYPFERQRHWVDPGSLATRPAANDDARKEFADWFYVTDWQSTVASGGKGDCKRVLVFAGTRGLSALLVERLRERGTEVVTATVGSNFSFVGDRIVLNPEVEEDWEALSAAAGAFSHVVYLWPLDTAMTCTRKVVAGCFDHLLRIGKRIEQFRDPASVTKLLVVTANAQQLVGEAGANPYQALVCGPVRTIPQEYPGVQARWVDMDAASLKSDMPQAAAQLLLELDTGGDETTIAWRHGRRLRPVPTTVPLARQADGSALRRGGTYLIVGGFGEAGQALAMYLATEYRAHLVLVSRTLPSPSEPDEECLDASLPAVGACRRSRLVRLLASAGATVDVVAADVGDGPALERAVSGAGLRHLDGIFHAAGVFDDAAMSLKSIDAAHGVLHPKVAGALGLQSLMAMAPDFVLYFSSLGVQTGVAGQVDYTSANAFMDAFAANADANSRCTRHVSVQWGSWSDASRPAGSGLPDRDGLADAEAMSAIEAILGNRTPPQIMVAPHHPKRLLEQARTADEQAPCDADAESRSPRPGRPELSVEYLAPESKIERTLASAWESVLEIGNIGVRDNFFALGGNSLLLMRLVYRLSRQQGITLPLEQALGEPTIANWSALALHADQNVSTPVQPIRRVDRSRHRIPLSS
ncbi:MAG: acyltransferase domain-containing protein [Pseudomonadota bacterium]|nr:acyltransferase domain-containing protein [Pseudomonadota bacterium]